MEVDSRELLLVAAERPYPVVHVGAGSRAEKGDDGGPCTPQARRSIGRRDRSPWPQSNPPFILRAESMLSEIGSRVPIEDQFKDRLSCHHSNDPCKTVTHVYQYTGFAALKSILGKKEIQVNETTFMNDRMEVKEFAQSSVTALSQMIYASDMQPHPRNRGNVWKIDYFRNALRAPCSRPAYVASFSAEKSLLSQWRAYSPHGGVSIGIPLNGLRDVSVANGLSATWCEYGAADMRVLFRPPPQRCRISRHTALARAV